MSSRCSQRADLQKEGNINKDSYDKSCPSPRLCGYLNLNNQYWREFVLSVHRFLVVGWVELLQNVAECCRCKTAASEGATGHQRCLGALVHGATWRQKWCATSSMTRRLISLLSVWSSTSFSLERSASERFMTWWAGFFFDPFEPVDHAWHPGSIRLLLAMDVKCKQGA